MQRWTPPLVLALSLALALFVSRTPAAVHAATAATLPAGWNLVAGSEGATLSGASGQIYTLQPGDPTYEIFPASSTLKAGWGYWAYFPSGGSVNTPSSRNSYNVVLSAGAWAMVGNPTSDCTVSISGADTVLAYTPSGGYVQATTLGVGQGAWVIGSGRLTLTPGTCVTQPAAPSPTATPAPAATSSTPAGPDLTTINGLQAVALQQSDLPGFSVDNSMPTARVSFPDGVIGFAAAWVDQDDRSPRIAVINILETFLSPAQAHAAFMNAVADSLSPGSNDPSLQVSNAALQGSKGLGDEDTAAYYEVTNSHGVQFDNYTETFRYNLTVVQVLTVDFTPTGSLLNPVSYAGTILHRMQGH